jgi:hypothetical protein
MWTSVHLILRVYYHFLTLFQCRYFSERWTPATLLHILSKLLFSHSMLYPSSQNCTLLTLYCFYLCWSLDHLNVEFLPDDHLFTSCNFVQSDRRLRYSVYLSCNGLSPRVLIFLQGHYVITICSVFLWSVVTWPQCSVFLCRIAFNSVGWSPGRITMCALFCLTVCWSQSCAFLCRVTTW